ncbi:hypothetical protein ANN_22778 [Periplaneta americana]|uniref:Uncharacterized protein n=1 Tax=Periplaneta americana TaxID=6978 RepID=A0ABQ8SJA2_PERAM|nr:hypothetical protein ANN_22778 [Periplaneta americana]
MAGLCEGGNEPPGSLKAITQERPQAIWWYAETNSRRTHHHGPPLRHGNSKGKCGEIAWWRSEERVAAVRQAYERSPRNNKRQAFAIDMLQHIDEDPAFLTRIAFSDEATFHLSGKVNTHNGPTRWPPRSPDITPLDFFLWGYVKNKVYTGHKIRDLQQLRGRIRDAVNSVTPEMLRKTWQEIEFRLDVLRATRGSHVEVY